MVLWIVSDVFSRFTSSDNSVQDEARADMLKLKVKSTGNFDVGNHLCTSTIPHPHAYTQILYTDFPVSVRMGPEAANFFRYIFCESARNIA